MTGLTTILAGFALAAGAAPAAPPSAPSVAVIRLDHTPEEVSHVPLATGQTVSAVLSAAGGVPDGEVNEVWVQRAMPGGLPEVLPVDCTAIRAGVATETDLRPEPGDCIYIAPQIAWAPSGSKLIVYYPSIWERLEMWRLDIEKLFGRLCPDGQGGDSPR